MQQRQHERRAVAAGRAFSGFSERFTGRWRGIPSTLIALMLIAACGPAERVDPEQAGAAGSEPPTQPATAGSAAQPVEPAQPITGMADRVFVNGRVLTVDPEFTIVEAIAVSGDRILAVGANAEIEARAGPGATRTDLGGHAVIPGLIDNHMHFMRATRDWYRHVRWDGIASREDALAMLADRSEQLPDGEWVVVIGGWTFGQFRDDRSLFTVAELDAAVPDRPVYVQEGYRRAFVNSAALAAADVDPASVDFTARGAMGLVNDAIPQVDAATWDDSFRATMEDLHAMGLTAVYDVGGNGVTPEYYESARRLADNGELTMRVFYAMNPGMGIGPEAESIVDALESNAPDLDGLSFARFGWGESTYGPMRATPWRLSAADRAHYESIASAAIRNGWQLHEHSMRDEKIDAMLGVFEDVNAQQPITGARWTIAHTNGISERSIGRAVALGMVFAVHSSSRLSAPGAGAPPPIGTIDRSGGIWGLGSDATTVASPNPFHNIGWAVTGRSPDGSRNLTDTVSRAAALAAHTRSNGYILFREDHLGSLEPGKLADFAVLDRNYMTVPASEIGKLRSVMTVVGGRAVYADPGIPLRSEVMQ
jgi:predicted amidohydrolase YtcJ